MLTKIKSLMFTSFAVVFTFIAASSMNACCPVLNYQPEPPRKA